jgi:predicted ArsR family transcriptional regulator
MSSRRAATEEVPLAEGEDGGTVDWRRHRVLADPSRARILREVADRGPLDVARVAGLVGLHVNTARTHLTALAEAGLVDTERVSGPGPGRPRLLYRSTESAQSELRHYRLLAEILTGLVAQAGPGAIPGLEAAGETWGHHLVDSPPPLAEVGEEEALERLLDLLTRGGFAPRPERAPGDSGAVRILMRPCPFLELARRHRDVVCPVHLGLVRGALAELGGALTATTLEPFVTPELCVATVAPTRANSSPAPPGRKARP